MDPGNDLRIPALGDAEDATVLAPLQGDQRVGTPPPVGGALAVPHGLPHLDARRELPELVRGGHGPFPSRDGDDVHGRAVAHGLHGHEHGQAPRRPGLLRPQSVITGLHRGRPFVFTCVPAKKSRPSQGWIVRKRIAFFRANSAP